MDYCLRCPVDCILDAVLTVSPTRQYLGMIEPTTPVTTGPVWIPLRIWRVSPGLKKKIFCLSNHAFKTQMSVLDS